MTTSYKLFEVYGVELEYMIVDRETLGVLPISDELLKSVAGSYKDEIELEEISWSNELIAHLIELKTTKPLSSLTGLASSFNKNIAQINQILEDFSAMLLPTAMHPTMDPLREAKIWRHEGHEIYQAFDRVFSCNRHGWANLQSVHLNLPFSSEEEFAALHAAIRLVLPLVPALAASSPIIAGTTTGILDNRLDVYRSHTALIPSMVGRVIPEAIYTKADYERLILEPIYRDVEQIKNFDAKILQNEWSNARGAIARFDRNSIEIRLIDVQETPIADLAICWFLSNLTRALIEGHFSKPSSFKNASVQTLEKILLGCISQAESSLIDDQDFLGFFGIKQNQIAAGDLLKELYQKISTLYAPPQEFQPALAHILKNGTLASRITKRLGREFSAKELRTVYIELAQCLKEGRLFNN